MVQRGFDDAREVDRLPSPSLVARLRATVRLATKAEALRRFLESLRTSRARPEGEPRKKSAWRSFERCRCRQKPLVEWLVHWLDHWASCQPVQTELKRLDLPLDLLDEDQQWELLQGHLDAFCESVRRRAQGQRKPARQEVRS